MRKEKIFYYSDLLNDDFAGNNIKTKEMDSEYDYKHFFNNKFLYYISNIFYFIIAQPIFIIMNKITLKNKFINKKKLKEVKGGYFIYGNHTQITKDAIIPTLLNLKKKNYILVGPDAFSIKRLKYILQSLGAIPLPNTYSKAKDMLEYMQDIIDKKSTITIYPEAHIWPYYTKIRPYKETSFKYPAIFDVPVFSFTNCYKKRILLKKPKIITIIDGPFYPKKELSQKENAIYLRNCCYDVMCNNAKKYSNYEYIKYKYKENRE